MGSNLGKAEIKKEKHITVIGDSTIDNKIWVGGGLFGNYLYDRLGLKRNDSATRVKQSHELLNHTELSVVEHLMDCMPEYTIHDYTNDGFTTGDCLRGAYRDKVFGKGTFSAFPHEPFYPLIAGAEDIQKSQHIVLSIGGNNFREFLQVAKGIPSKHVRKHFIEKEFPKVMQTLKEEYIQIFQKIRELNPGAQIVLMTQYYPSASQNNYQLYPFLKELGGILHLGRDPDDPMDVIHAIMQATYKDVINAIKHDDNFVIADITSSINPFDKNNHVSQIEPSAVGGRKIAQALDFVIKHGYLNRTSYQFLPEFFAQEELVYKNKHVLVNSSLEDWQPKHPYTLLLEAKNISPQKQAEIQLLLNSLLEWRNAFLTTDRMYIASDQVYQEAKGLLLKLNTEDEANHFMASINVAIKMMVARDKTTVQDLKQEAIQQTQGKPEYWHEFTVALMLLAGACIMSMNLASLLFSGGLSAGGLLLGGSLLSIGGTALFFKKEQKPFARSLSQLAETAEASFEPSPMQLQKG